jgi:hypothetical protein
MPDLYFSTDIEADGPIPGPHSMLSFASVAITAEGQVLGSYAANLALLDGAAPHPRTTEFWAKNPQAYAATRVAPSSPDVAIPRYVQWVESLPGSPVFVAYPATFDFMFMHWYMIRFTGKAPFGHSALDMKTFAWSILKRPFRESTKNNFPKEWFTDKPHTHIAADDALEQAHLFINMLTHRNR